MTKKHLFGFLFSSLFFTNINAQFTLCSKCGETRNGNTLTIEGENKGSWTVKYNIMGHTTTFIASNGEKITLQSEGSKKIEAPDGRTTRHSTSEDGNWKAEVVYNGHSFIKAVLTKVK
jgi:hypothetical protein